jgi:hypothetical protein
MITFTPTDVPAAARVQGLAVVAGRRGGSGERDGDDDESGGGLAVGSFVPPSASPFKSSSLGHGSGGGDVTSALAKPLGRADG